MYCRVEYFGQKLDGFAFTTGGWVQSYGSRYGALLYRPLQHLKTACVARQPRDC